MSILPSDAPRRSRPSAPSPVVIALVVLVLVALAGGAYQLTRPASVPAAAPPVNLKTLVTPKATSTVAPKSAPPTTAAAALAASKAAVLAQGWVHVNVDVRAPGHVVTISSTSGLSDGIQKIGIGSAQATVLVVGDETFVHGNASGLHQIFGMGPVALKRWGSHWLRLQAGDKPYDGFTKAVTMASLFDSLFDASSPRSALTLLPARTLHGVKVFGVRGTRSAGSPAGTTATLWIAVDTNLPVTYGAATADSSLIMTSTFSKWGAALTLVPPDDILVLRAPLPLNGV